MAEHPQEVYQTNFEKWIGRDRMLHPSRSVEDLEVRMYYLHQCYLEQKAHTTLACGRERISHIESVQKYHKFMLDLLDKINIQPHMNLEEVRGWIKNEKLKNESELFLLKAHIEDVDAVRRDITSVNRDYESYNEDDGSYHLPYSTIKIPDTHIRFNPRFAEDPEKIKLDTLQEIKSIRKTKHSRKRMRAEELDPRALNSLLLDEEKKGHFSRVLPDDTTGEECEQLLFAIKRRKLSLQDQGKELKKILQQTDKEIPLTPIRIDFDDE